MAVAINGHMLSWLARTDGANGEFIKANRHPSGGNCFVLATPFGRKLAGGHGSGGAAEALKKGLAEWNRLTDSERRALPAGERVQPPEAARCAPPPCGLVLRVYVRNLKQNRPNDLARITAEDLKDRSKFPDWNPIYIEPAHYHLWLTEAEWKSLLPARLREGDSLSVPSGIEKRIFRYHLLMARSGSPLPGVWRTSAAAS